ncbi:hypothetical protein N2E09_01690 [Leuconostoc citreum]
MYKKLTILSRALVTKSKISIMPTKVTLLLLDFKINSANIVIKLISERNELATKGMMLIGILREELIYKYGIPMKNAKKKRKPLISQGERLTIQGKKSNWSRVRQLGIDVMFSY